MNYIKKQKETDLSIEHSKMIANIKMNRQKNKIKTDVYVT